MSEWDQYKVTSTRSSASSKTSTTTRLGPITISESAGKTDTETALENARLTGANLSNKKAMIDINKAKREKIPAAQLGYYTMAEAAIEDYNALRSQIANKKLTHDDIRLAFGKTPTDQTAIINNILYNGTDGWLRIQTGAQANPSEIQREMSKFQPKPWDSDKVIDYKLDSLFKSRLQRYKMNLERNSGVEDATSKKQPVRQQVKQPVKTNKGVEVDF